jgi:hypothetical protein
MSSTGYYVYGLIRANENLEFGAIGLEHKGRPGRVHALREDSIAAVVSSYSGREKVLPLPRNLQPHNRVIQEITRSMTIIPMTFGHVAMSEEEIRKMLRSNRRGIQAQLERVHGRVEMGLKVVWGVDNIFEHFVSQDSELTELRDEIFGRSTPPSKFEKIELGHMFDQRLHQERVEQTALALELLRPWAVKVRVNPARNEKTVMDLSFLVEREDLRPFEECVYQAADVFPAQHIFDLSGPWAPFSFIDLELAQLAA